MTVRNPQRRSIDPAGVGVWLVTGLVAVAGLSGCGGDFKVRQPRMPTMGATSATPLAAASPDEVFATASAAVEREDLAAVVRALEMLAAGDRTAVVRKLMTALAQRDFVKAEAVAQAMPPGPMQHEATEILARAMAEREPEAALPWALALASPSMALSARLAVADQLAAREPKLAMERLRTLPVSPARDEMMGYTAAAWARRDADAALAWLRDLAPGEVKNRATTSIGFAFAQSHPPRAVGLLETLPDGRDRMVLIGAIGQTWVARDANEAWRWANQFPAGAARQAALAGIETGLGGAGARIARSEPSAPHRSGGGIGSGRTRGGGAVPLGLERDDALRRGFEAALRESPVNAASYLTSLPSPDRRDDMVDELVRRWLPLNPEAAKTWVDQNIPNPVRREELLREAGLRAY